MVFAMNPQQVSFRDDATNQRRMPLGFRQQDKERRAHAMGSEQIQHAVGQALGRPIIEAQQQRLTCGLRQLPLQLRRDQQIPQRNPAPQQIQQCPCQQSFGQQPQWPVRRHVPPRQKQRCHRQHDQRRDLGLSRPRYDPQYPQYPQHG